jgi:hypothetical protein
MPKKFELNSPFQIMACQKTLISLEGGRDLNAKLGTSLDIAPDLACISFSCSSPNDLGIPFGHVLVQQQLPKELYHCGKMPDSEYRGINLTETPLMTRGQPHELGDTWFWWR